MSNWNSPGDRCFVKHLEQWVKYMGREELRTESLLLLLLLLSHSSRATDSVWPHPWNSPGKNTGVGCHFLLQQSPWVPQYLVFGFSSVTQSCSTLCDPMECSTPGLPVHHQFPELAQTHVHRVSDAIQPSHPLPSPSPPAFNLSPHQSLFQWVSSSYQVAKVLELQL